MTEFSRLAVVATLLVTAIATGCRKPGAPPPSAPPAPASSSAPPAPAPPVGPATTAPLGLPDVIGFVSTAMSRGAGYVRRTYTRGPARIVVTLARMPMSADDYASWVKASASFAQAALDLPANDANGFYQCSEGPPPSCDLLIQLRSGLHLELRGGGTSSRDDVDALARGLPLGRLARN